MLSKKGPLLVLQNIINALAGLVGLFFVARILPVSWSIMSFGLAFAGLFTIVSDLGFSTANIRLQSQGEDEGECNSTFLLSKLLFSFSYVIITVLALLVWVDVLHRGFEYNSEFWVVLALVPYYFFFGLSKFSGTSYTSKMKPAKLVFPSIVEAVLRNSIFVLIAISFRVHLFGMDQEQTGILLSGIYSITYTVYFVTSFVIGRPWKFSRPSMKMFRKYTAIALPLALSAIVGTVNQNIDKVIIQFYWGIQATGAFFLDQRIVMVLTTFATSVSIFLLPILSRINATGSKSELNVSIKEYERVILLLSLPFATVLGIMNLYIVNLFSTYFTGYAYVLSLLSLFAIISLNSYPYMNGLIATGKQRSVAAINVMGVGTNIILNFITIPQSLFGVHYFSLGVAGGGFSTVVSAALMNIAFRIKLYRGSGARFNFELFKLIIPMVVQAVALYIILMYIRPFDILLLAPISVFSVLVYTGVAILMKELTMEEIVSFVRNVNPVRLIRTLREE